MKRLLFVFLCIGVLLCTAASAETLTLPSSTQRIEDEAFLGVQGVDGIVLPDDLQAIGSRVFANSSVRSLTIPANVSIIADDAFEGLSNDAVVTVQLNSEADRYFSQREVNFTVRRQLPYTPWEILDFHFSYDEYGFDENGEPVVDGLEITIYGFKPESEWPAGVTKPEGVFLSIPAEYENEPIERLVIENWSFYQSAYSGGIQLPDGVETAIYSEAFAECKGLTGELILPDSVIKIGSKAFYGCTGLSGELRLPNNNTAVDVTYPPKSVFAGCTGIESVQIPAAWTMIPDEYFKGCTGIRSVQFSEIWPKMGNYAFADCSSWTGTLALPSAMPEMGKGVFSGCAGLSAVQIPAECTSLPSEIFKGCAGISSIQFPEVWPQMGDYAFAGCTGLTGTFGLPAALPEMGRGVFSDCTGLTAVQIPETYTALPIEMFKGCTGLTGRLILPEALTEPGSRAFAGCTGLTSVQLPSGMTSIPDGLFADCTGMRGTLVLPSGVQSIGDEAFKNCGFSGRLSFPYAIASIGERAFYGCSGFTGGLNLRSIGLVDDEAFYGCSGLSGELYIPSSATTIGNDAFYGCSGFTSLTVEDGTELFAYVGGGPSNPNDHSIYGGTSYEKGSTDSSFAGLAAITKAKLGGEVVTIPERCFKDCTSLIELDADFSDLTKICASAFENCKSLISLPSFGAKMEMIASYAFKDCVSLTGVLYFPAPESGSGFSRSIRFGEGMPVNLDDPFYQLGNTFENCTSLSGLSFGERYGYRGEREFYYELSCRTDCFKGVSETFALFGAGEEIKEAAEEEGLLYYSYAVSTDSSSVSPNSFAVGLPRDFLYLGDPFTLWMRIDPNELFDTIHVRIVNQQGEAVQQASSTYPEKSCYLQSLVGTQLSFETLPVGSYKIIVEGVGSDITIKLAVSPFRIEHQPLQLTFSGDTTIRSSTISSQFVFTESMTASYPITSVTAKLHNITTEKDVATYTATPESTVFNFADMNSTFDFSSLAPLNTYRFTLDITTAEKGSSAVINTVFVLSDSGKSYTQVELQKIRNFVSNWDNLTLFNKYNDGLLFIADLGIGDQANLVFQSILNPTPMIEDLIDLEGNGQYVVDCYKTQLLNVLRKLNGTLDVTADIEDPWYTKAVEQLLSDGKLTLTTITGLTDFEEHFEFFTKEMSTTFSVLEEIFKAGDLAEIANTDILGILREYENSVRILNLYRDSEKYQANMDYRRAVNELMIDFTSEAAGAMVSTLNEIYKLLLDQMVDVTVKLVHTLFENNELASFYFSIVKWAGNSISKFAGWDEAAKGTVDMITQQSILSGAVQSYTEAFQKVANGDTSTEALIELELWFRTAQAAGMQVYEILLELNDDRNHLYDFAAAERIAAYEELKMLIYDSPYSPY